MARAAFVDLVHDTMEESVGGTFESFGVPLTRTSPKGKPYTICAVLGFSGDLARGGLGVATTEEVVRRALGPDGENATGEQIVDCLGELANQVLGKMKNRWVARGLDVTMATPVVLRGVSLSVTGASDTLFLPSKWTSEIGPVAVWVEGVVSPDLVLHEPSANDQVADEGSLMFF